MNHIARTILAAGLSAALAAPSAHAADTEQERRGALGFGIGMVLGAAVGGPPGGVLGSALGSTLAIGNLLTERLATSRGETAAARAALADREAEVARLERQQLASEQRVEQMRKVALTTPVRPAAPLLSGALELAVHFRTGSERLEPHYGPALRTLSTFAAALPGARIELVGHADPRGSDAVNDALSRARVESVRQALLRHGVADARIATAARGEQEPLAAAGDSEAWPFARRVEIRVVGDAGLHAGAGD